jgi:hypothetical protein
MKLDTSPAGTIDRAQVPAVVEAGETGTAAARTRNLGETRVRLIPYGDGYRADHRCAKGHIMHLI